VVFSNVTSSIMLPPPCHGGMPSSTDEEIGVQRLHVDGHVRDGLRPENAIPIGAGIATTVLF
jgi:hypothetical protein